ncbi:MAG: potassium transporter Kup [Alphaproteobacteria bacterium]
MSAHNEQDQAISGEVLAEGAQESAEAIRKKKIRDRTLFIGCIGVVYGDIGTSPLYAFREAALRASEEGIKAAEIYGILSLILWALIIIVTLKYVLLMLNMDNKGEGGILSLMAMVQKRVRRGKEIVFLAAIAGAALFYGDAALTPAISVLSAVEGLKLVAPEFDKYVLPLAIVILFLLFYVQKGGTAKMSTYFGPITALWFLTMGFTGALWIFKNPAILFAFSPYYAVSFLVDHGTLSFFVLGGVFLAVTGVEALYADLGHFGRLPIQRAWLWLVFPCLSLNYLGQGAMLLQHPAAIENPFFLLVPEWALLPLVGLATIATVVASQATITGAMSLTRQGIQLGLLPRMEIRHTSATEAGQIFMPKVSSLLLICVLLLCVVFRESGALASAYGIAVNAVMIVTSILAFIAVPKVLKKSYLFASLVIIPFITVELVFFGSNLIKFFDGGFIPIVFAFFVVVMMVTWVQGTRYLHKHSIRKSISMVDLIEKMDRNPPHVVTGTAIFLTSDSRNAPEALTQNLRHNQIIHEKNIILTVAVAEVPSVPENQRLIIEHLSSRFVRVVISFGYMETPDVFNALYNAGKQGLSIDLESATFFLGRHKIISNPRRGLPGWQDKIYVAMSRSAVSATDFYRIPPSQVVEMGSLAEI